MRALLFFLCILGSLHSFPLVTEGRSPLPDGRLIFALHEQTENETESFKAESPGALTMRTASALHQQAGILIVSPRILENILHRKLLFYKSAQQKKSPIHTLIAIWRALQIQPSQTTFAHIQKAIKNRPTLLHLLFIWQLNLSSHQWHAWVHSPSGLLLFIPKEYSTDRMMILPRMLPERYAALEYATGLHLAQCTPLSLYATEKISSVDSLLQTISQGMNEKSFSITALQKLFITNEEVPPFLQTQWNVYAIGHGMLKQKKKQWAHLKEKKSIPLLQSRSENDEICGLQLHDFQQLLQFFNAHLNTLFFYYQSCYGGGAHLHSLLTNIEFDRRTIAEKVTLNYPLVAGALSEAPVAVITPHYTKDHDNNSYHFVVDTNISLFFDLLSEEKPLEQVLRAVTPPIPTAHDIHAISSTPLFLPPHSSQFIPIDVTKDPTRKSHSFANKAGIFHITTHHDKEHNDHHPLIITNQRALLISPFSLSYPLHLSSYTPPPHIAQKNKTLLPAIVSLIPGNAIHHIHSLTIEDGGLRELLLQSFLPFIDQQSSKVFLIDTVTLHNDLKSGFTRNHNEHFFNRMMLTIQSWFTTPSDTTRNDPRISLSNVIVYVRKNRLDCYFTEPCSDDVERSRKISQKSLHFDHESSNHHIPTTSDVLLTIQPIPTKQHLALYGKYLRLLQKQTIDEELNALQLVPVLTTWKRKK